MSSEERSRILSAPVLDFDDVPASEAIKVGKDHYKPMSFDGNDSFGKSKKKSVIVGAASIEKSVVQTYPAVLMETESEDIKYIFALIGLPGRGKSYISRKLARYLTWTGFEVKSFNLSTYRRKQKSEIDSSYYDPSQKAYVEERNQLARSCVKDIMEYLVAGGHIGIYDATNTSTERQKMVKEVVSEYVSKYPRFSFKIVWIESIYEDVSLIDAAVKEFQNFSPDYASWSQEDASKDFEMKTANYEKTYSSMDDGSQTFIKYIDGGRQIIMNRVEGYLLGKVVSFLMHLRANKRPIFMSRHGESEYNVEGKIGGDSSLSERGRSYAAALGNFISVQPEISDGLKVWCSTLKRTIETSSYIKNVQPLQWRALSEIEVGTCDGMTYEEIEEKFPEEFLARKVDKLRYRYPRGESYLDVIQRLEPVIYELERANCPVLVIGHRAVLRCLYAYFVDLPAEDVAHLKIPLHTVIKLTPKAYGTNVETLEFGIGSVDQVEDQKLT
jgi:6-phosphofructo-2-kinase/fructose-2,6-biphosphatase 2